MRPDPGRTLQGVAMNLLTNVMAETKTPFGQQTVGFAAGLALMAAEEFDRAADRLATENAIVRTLLADSLEFITGEATAVVEAALARPAPADIKVSTLLAENDALRAAMIVAHAAVEETDTTQGEAMCERFWAELIESTKRRHFASRLG